MKGVAVAHRKARSSCVPGRPGSLRAGWAVAGHAEETPGFTGEPMRWVSAPWGEPGRWAKPVVWAAMSGGLREAPLRMQHTEAGGQTSLQRGRMSELRQCG